MCIKWAFSTTKCLCSSAPVTCALTGLLVQHNVYVTMPFLCMNWTFSTIECLCSSALVTYTIYICPLGHMQFFFELRPLGLLFC